MTKEFCQQVYILFCLKTQSNVLPNRDCKKLDCPWYRGKQKKKHDWLSKVKRIKSKMLNNE